MGVVHLKEPLPLSALGVVVIYCPQKYEKAQLLISSPKGTISVKKWYISLKKLRKRKTQETKAGNHKRDDKRKRRVQSG
jgi:hypothetical protein